MADLLTPAAIVVRIFANPASNVLQKLAVQGGASPVFVIAATHGLLSIAVVPWLLARPLPDEPEFWVNMALCAVLAAAANALLVQAVKLADLSVLGPINAYKAVVSLLPALVLLGETPSPQALAGIVLIVVGSYALREPQATSADEAPVDDVPPPASLLRLSLGVRYRLAALVLSATEAVFLKRALAYTTPGEVFAWWAVLGLAAAALWTLPRRLRIEWSAEIHNAARAAQLYLPLAATTGLMQLCTLFAFAEVQVAAALALFQTSAIVSVLLGHHVFREPHLGRRLAGTLVMVAGSVLVVLGRNGS